MGEQSSIFPQWSIYNIKGVFKTCFGLDLLEPQSIFEFFV